MKANVISRFAPLLPLLASLMITCVIPQAWADDQPARPAEELRPPRGGPDGFDGPPPPPPEGERERGDRERGDRGDRGPREMSPEEIDEAISIVRAFDPTLADRLQALRETDPQQVARELNERFPRYRWLLRMKRYDPEMFELRMTDIQMFQRDRELAEVYKKAKAEGDQAKADQARADLLAHMQEHFNHRRKIDELELQRLEQRLASLRQEIEERKANRDQLIEKYVGMLLDPQREKGREGPEGPGEE